MQPQDGRAGLSQMRERLEGFRAYARLVVEQEAAVASGGQLDLAAHLGARREEMQRRLDIGGELAPPTGAPAPDEADEARQIQAETAKVLLETARVHERMTAQLRALRDGARESAGAITRSRSSVGTYLGNKTRDRRGVNIRF